MRGLGTLLLASMIAVIAGSACAKDLAICGASAGYGYYPRIGLTASSETAGKWTDDAISGGRMTLVALADNKLDLLIADASGSIFSSTQDGGHVVALGRTPNAIAIAVVYPGSIESYTFLRSRTGPEVIWTSNKFNAPIVKAAAYRAECSLIDFE